MPHQLPGLTPAAVVSFGLRLLSAVGAAGAVICYKDQNPANPDPYNMYQCEDSAKPYCCQEGDLSTCCDYNPTQRTILQQLTIWGLLLSTMVGLIVIYLCCFRAKNNSGTEIRSSEEQNTGCSFGHDSGCCSLLNHGNKETEDGKRYQLSDQI